ncbi:MAG: hypothetical protein Q3993_04805, partial [Filifactor alocis]|nr:hypothetical protein [Filifactor alocis]
KKRFLSLVSLPLYTEPILFSIVESLDKENFFKKSFFFAILSTSFSFLSTASQTAMKSENLNKDYL